MFKQFLKKWSFLFIIIALDYIIALRTSIEFYNFFFLVLLSLSGVSVIWILLGYLFVEVDLERNFSYKIEEDDYLDIEVKIKNRSFLPLFNFVLEDHLACAQEGDRGRKAFLEYIRPRSSISVKYGCFCPLRGRYLIGPFKVYIFDPLGIFFLKKTRRAYSEIFVYPQTFNIRQFPALKKGAAPWFGIEASRASGDEHEFYGVREYRPKDPVKKIHWLSTARKNRLIVKQYQRHVFCRATLIFNLNQESNYGAGRHSLAEYTVKIAASVAKYLIEQGVSLEIIAHAQEMLHLPFNKGPEHLQNILRALTVAKAESGVSTLKIFQEFYRYIPPDSSLIVIMPDTDQKYLFSMLALKERNVSFIPLILLSSTFLYSASQKAIAQEAKFKFTGIPGLHPLFFSCRTDLAQAFL
ncbi:MAG: DUF58 domain-containing protein [Candidatus Omnitrophica bacterium]|nr:DUF58 domain-containing protein [Candidatus Omnitrophota bacterium]